MTAYQKRKMIGARRTWGTIFERSPALMRPKVKGAMRRSDRPHYRDWLFNQHTAYRAAVR